MAEGIPFEPKDLYEHFHTAHAAPSEKLKRGFVATNPGRVDYLIKQIEADGDKAVVRRLDTFRYEVLQVDESSDLLMLTEAERDAGEVLRLYALADEVYNEYHRKHGSWPRVR